MKLSATAMIVAALLALPACDGGDKSTTSDDSTGEATDASATDASATDASATDATTGTPTTGDPTTETTGSPAELSFAADVWDPILSPTCSCHGAGSGGLTMGADAATAYAALVGVKSIGSPLNHVEAGDSTASYLINKLEGTQIEAGGSGGKMPLAGMVSADQIQTIKDWIDAGALP